MMSYTSVVASPNKHGKVLVQCFEIRVVRQEFRQHLIKLIESKSKGMMAAGFVHWKMYLCMEKSQSVRCFYRGLYTHDKVSWSVVASSTNNCTDGRSFLTD